MRSPDRQFGTRYLLGNQAAASASVRDLLRIGQFQLGEIGLGQMLIPSLEVCSYAVRRFSNRRSIWE